MKLVKWEDVHDLEKYNSIFKKTYSKSNCYKELNKIKSWQYELRLNGTIIHINPEICASKCLSFLEDLKRQNDYTTVQDYTLPLSTGICHNVQLIKDNYEKKNSHSICINLSRVIPFFHIHVLNLNREKDNFPKWNGLPYRVESLETQEYAKIIRKIRMFLSSKLGLYEFPNELVDKKISAIPSGEKFTYYNAFFAESFYTR